MFKIFKIIDMVLKKKRWTNVSAKSSKNYIPNFFVIKCFMITALCFALKAVKKLFLKNMLLRINSKKCWKQNCQLYFAIFLLFFFLTMQKLKWIVFFPLNLTHSWRERLIRNHSLITLEEGERGLQSVTQRDRRKGRI